MRRILIACTLIGLIGATATLADIEIELRSAEDTSRFGVSPDCRSASPRTCRGLILVDSSESPPIRGWYLAFAVTNLDTSPYDDVWVSLSGFGDEDPPGNLARIAEYEAENPGDPREDWYASYRIGALAPGETGAAFFYIDITDPASFIVPGTETRPDLAVWDGLPYQGNPIVADSALPACDLVSNQACLLPDGAVEWPFIATETITAATNRILDAAWVGDTFVVGSRPELLVVGESGLSGNPADFDGDGDPDSFLGFSPSTHVTWPGKPIRLTGTNVAISGDNACGLADCSCTSEPPAPGECDFVRQDGGPPACELRVDPGLLDPSCIIYESENALQLVLEDGVSYNYVASYLFRVFDPWPVEVLSPTHFVSSGEQIKHTNLYLEDCLNAGSELDPVGTGCCALPEIDCIGPMIPDALVLMADRGPGPGEVSLAWTGAAAPFEVFRTNDPAQVMQPESKIGETADPHHVDIPPVAGLHFYKVGGACYPDEEICDGLDNNCDGEVDEGYLRCGDPLHCPSLEVCNGEDDDCDDQVDEDDVCGGCVWSPEICDGCDNDCDGIADNPPAGGFEVLDCGFPEPPNCLGTRTCMPSQPVFAPGECAPGAGYGECIDDPEVEVCDGLDNNCDGATDEGFLFTDWDGSQVPLGGSCGTGACAGGIVQCRADGTDTECSTGYLASPEACDGFDNDCDGEPDEDFLDQNGRYNTDEHCGACGNNCTLLTYGNLPGVCNGYNYPTPACSIDCSATSCYDCNGDPGDGCEVCDPTPGQPICECSNGCEDWDGDISNGCEVCP